MSFTESEAEGTVRLAVENVGGIDRTHLTFAPGITVLAGRNATNRTSLLQALMAALGSEHVSLKGDAEEGRVELEIGKEICTRTLDRAGNEASSGPAPIDTGGEPYTEDAELADLFAFLVEANEARRAVARSEDLRELIMRPVDTEALQAEIDRLESEKRDLDSEIDRLDSLAGRPSELEGERDDLDERIAEQRETLAATEDDLAAADRDVEETREERAELDEKLDALGDARSAIEATRLDVESERRSIAALREEKADLEADPNIPGGEGEDENESEERKATSSAAETERIESELAERRERVQALETTINELQTIIGFNEKMLNGESASSAVLDALRDGEGQTGTDNDRAGGLTDQLVTDNEIVCWTCGSEIERDRIEATLDRLRAVRADQLEKRRSLREEIDNLETRKDELESRRRERERRERELRSIEAELDGREARLEALQDEREALEEDIEALENEVEALQGEEQSELLDLHEQANQLEFELGRLQREREDVDKEIERVEAHLAEREALEAKRENVDGELTDLRGRIERLEEGAITEFNEHMETILELLDYANVERVWLERREREIREGRHKVTKSVFDLHVIRSTDSGATYEDTIAHLSESEREVTGLVFALAGYLAHDLHESMPFVLLDSLETIDAERIAALVEHFGEYAQYVVVALLPEDAAALDEGYERVTDI